RAHPRDESPVRRVVGSSHQRRLRFVPAASRTRLLHYIRSSLMTCSTVRPGGSLPSDAAAEGSLRKRSASSRDVPRFSPAKRARTPPLVHEPIFGGSGGRPPGQHC